MQKRPFLYYRNQRSLIAARDDIQPAALDDHIRTIKDGCAVEIELIVSLHIRPRIGIICHQQIGKRYFYVLRLKHIFPVFVDLNVKKIYAEKFAANDALSAVIPLLVLTRRTAFSALAVYPKTVVVAFTLANTALVAFPLVRALFHTAAASTHPYVPNMQVITVTRFLEIDLG